MRLTSEGSRMRTTALAALAVLVAVANLAVAEDWSTISIPDSPTIYDMDHEGGTVWLASHTRGLMGYDDGLWVLHLAEEGGIRTNNYNYTILVDSSGDKWVGRDNVNAVDRLDDGGTFFDKSDDTWTYYTYQESLEIRRVFSMAEAPEGGMWLGQRDESHNNAGTVELLIENDDSTTDDDQWYHYDNASTPDSTNFSDDDVRALATDLSGRLWIGYYASGVDVWDYGNPAVFTDDTWSHYTDLSGLPSNLVHTLHVAEDGRVWVGTLGGLAVYDPGADSWQTIDGLPGLQARAVDTDALGHVWVGTDEGVAMLYGNGTVAVTYDTDDGLPNELIRELAVDRVSGTIWVISVNEGTQATSLSYLETVYGEEMSTAFVYPNPWKEGGDVREITVFGVREGSEVTIMDLTGQEVRTLEPTQPYVWDTLDDSQNEVPSGVYVIRVEAPEGDVSIAKAAVIR
ncbi:MAG: T9SS type A sorting domain-containing protein [Candidatus Eisenbacteria bacterium]|nr:T9SS type A sorting domain-containing protein [Candidatus Eisenbacteria bacterium]